MTQGRKQAASSASPVCSSEGRLHWPASGSWLPWSDPGDGQSWGPPAECPLISIPFLWAHSSAAEWSLPQPRCIHRSWERRWTQNWWLGGQGIRKNKASLKGWTVILSSRYRNYLLLARPRQKRKSFTHSHTFTGSKLETVTTFSFNLSFIFSEVWKQSIILVYKVILKIPLLLIFMGPRNHCDITFHSAIFQET